MLHKIRVAIGVVSIALIGVMHANGQQTFTISGKLADSIQGIVKLGYTEYADGAEKYQDDSAIVKNGQFSFKGKVAYPVLAQLRLYLPNRGWRDRGVAQSFYLESGALTITSLASLDKAIVTGGQSQTLYAAWQQQRQPLNDSINNIYAPGYELGKAMNGEGISALKRRGSIYEKKLKQVDSSFIASHGNSQVVFNELFKKLGRGRVQIQETEAALAPLPESVRLSSPAQLLAEKLAIAKQLQPGKPAPAFTLNDLSGRPVSLSSFKGRYVLLVFANYVDNMYATSFLFNIQRVHNRLKLDNFTILTILGDQDMAKAAELIRDKGMNWTHVVNNNGQALKELEKKYGMPVQTQNAFLIGPDGNFVKTDITLDLDMTTQIKGKIPGATGYLAKTNKPASANEPLNVYLGDEITAYPNVEWVKGGPITHFDKDTIYIVELWATWCVPCIAAMPHLSELQRKFKDKKVVIIAQGVWEKDKTKVVEFVQKNGSDLDYLVAFSGPHDSDFDKRWCVPAQVTGIPQTFVIQDNKLVWQTYPTTLNDEILQLLVDKQFTIAKAEALQSDK